MPATATRSRKTTKRTTAAKTTKKRQAATPTPTVQSVQTPAPQAQPAPQVPLVDTLVLSEMFREDGAFAHRETFKYNRVDGGAYLLRKAIFDRIAKATKDEIMALSRRARNVAFAVVKAELARYFGTGVRKQDNLSTGAKAGEPLPQLTFVNGAAAVAYRESMKAASANLRLAVFGNNASN